MLIQLRTLFLAVLAFVCLALAACGGSGGDDSADDDPGTSPPARDDSADGSGDDSASNDGGELDDDLFASSGIEVLGRSAASFSSDEITSASSEITFGFVMGDTDVSGNATFVFEAPDKMHMVMTFEGGDGQSLIDLSEVGEMEMLVRDGKVFMNIPFLGGWFVMDPASMGGDASAIQDLLSRGSLFDYSGLIQGFGSVDPAAGAVEFVGEEEVEGQTTAHYRITGELADLISAFADALSSTGDSGFSEQILTTEVAGPITIDLWVGMEDFLPYRMEASAEFTTAEGTFSMTLEGRFFGYNEPANIPEAPPDAQSFADLFGGLMPSTAP